MIRDTVRLKEFEREQAAERSVHGGYLQALAVLRALWSEAAALNADFPGDWRTDVEEGREQMPTTLAELKPNATSR
jgi:hypothetical protein